MTTPELQAKIYEWRQKAIAGTLTREESIAAVRVLTEGRIRAAAASTTSRAKKAAAQLPLNINTESILNDMMKDMG